MSKNNLNEIAKKVEKGIRLSKDDAMTLMGSNDIVHIGQLANKIREKKSGYLNLLLIMKSESLLISDQVMVVFQVLLRRHYLLVLKIRHG